MTRSHAIRLFPFLLTFASCASEEDGPTFSQLSFDELVWGVRAESTGERLFVTATVRTTSYQDPILGEGERLSVSTDDTSPTNLANGQHDGEPIGGTFAGSVATAATAFRMELAVNGASISGTGDLALAPFAVDVTYKDGNVVLSWPPPPMPAGFTTTITAYGTCGPPFERTLLQDTGTYTIQRGELGTCAVRLDVSRTRKGDIVGLKGGTGAATYVQTRSVQVEVSP